jgi:hypothetical protein
MDVHDIKTKFKHDYTEFPAAWLCSALPATGPVDCWLAPSVFNHKYICHAKLNFWANISWLCLSNLNINPNPNLFSFDLIVFVLHLQTYVYA